MPAQKFVNSIAKEIENNSLLQYPVLGQLYLKLVQLRFINVHVAKEFADKLKSDNKEYQKFIEALREVVAEQLQMEPRKRRAPQEEGEESLNFAPITLTIGSRFDQESSDSKKEPKKSKNDNKCIIS